MNLDIKLVASFNFFSR